MAPGIIIALIQLIIREAPDAIAAIRALLAKNNPTDADFEAAKEQIRKDTYEKVVSNTQLPPMPKV